MKKIILMGAALCTLTLFSCKKDKDSTTPAAQGIDAVALSAGMKVGYATNSTTGSYPASSTDADAPVLDSMYNNLTYTAISSRYIVIRPQVYSGDVQGYYVQVNGAGSYFKIDYTNARNLKKAKKSADQKHSSAKEDNTDSSIVIKLPANLVADTFSISYAAYDYNNKVSNSINAIIAVAAVSDTTGTSALTGTWRRNKYGDGIDSWGDSIIYNKPDTSFNYNYYICNNGQLTYYWYDYSQPRIDSVPSYYNNNIKDDYVFKAGNAFSNSYDYTYGYLNMGNSSCSQYIFDNYEENDTENGGYVYDPKTKTLVIIWDNDGYDDNNLYVDTYKVLSVTNKKMVLVSYWLNNNNHDNISYNYYEYIKL